MQDPDYYKQKLKRIQKLAEDLIKKLDSEDFVSDKTYKFAREILKESSVQT